MLYACGTKPLPDEFLAAPQASSLLSVDDNGPWFRSISRSHDFSSPIMLEMKKYFSWFWKRTEGRVCKSCAAR
jgi:hypothetical protein